MYQVNVVFTLSSKRTLELTWFQRWLKQEATVVTVCKDGTVSFVAASINDAVNVKLPLLVEDMDTVKSVTLNKL